MRRAIVQRSAVVELISIKLPVFRRGISPSSRPATTGPMIQPGFPIDLDQRARPADAFFCR
jgi:hypothetical protein